MNRTRSKPERGTPCGYCFSRHASGWDHLVPISASGTNSPDNLYPSCKRCNNLLSNFLFNSIEEKQTYVRNKLHGENGHLAVQALRERYRETEERQSFLLPEMQVEELGSKKSESKGEITGYSIAKVDTICHVCKKGFTKDNRRRFFKDVCSSNCAKKANRARAKAKYKAAYRPKSGYGRKEAKLAAKRKKEAINGPIHTPVIA